MNKPTSDVIAQLWARYEEQYLDRDPPDPVTRSLVKASFYYGVWSMLGLVETVLLQANSASAVELSLDAFRDEVIEHIEAGAAERH